MTEPLVLAWAQRRGPTQQGQSKINHKPHRTGIIRCALGPTLHETVDDSRAAQPNAHAKFFPQQGQQGQHLHRPAPRRVQCVVVLQCLVCLQCVICSVQCAVCSVCAPRNENGGRGHVLRPCLTSQRAVALSAVSNVIAADCRLQTAVAQTRQSAAQPMRASAHGEHLPNHAPGLFIAAHQPSLWHPFRRPSASYWLGSANFPSLAEHTAKNLTSPQLSSHADSAQTPPPRT